MTRFVRPLKQHDRQPRLLALYNELAQAVQQADPARLMAHLSLETANTTAK